MSDQDIITPDLIKDAEYVSAAWRVATQSRLEGIFETGKRLIEIRDKYKNADGTWSEENQGKWSRLIGHHQWKGQSLLPFEKSQTFSLIRIAECERLVRHVGPLPDDTVILSKLVSLSDERFQEMIDDGTIHPNMGRADMDASKVSKKVLTPFVPPANNADPSKRIAVLESTTVEEVVDKGMSMEHGGLQPKEVALGISLDPRYYELMKNVVLVSRCNHLSPMDRINIDEAIEAINEYKIIRPIYERVELIIKHVWGDRRGMLGRDADVERRHKEFNRVLRLITNTCKSAPEIDIPYLDQEQVGEALQDLTQAVKGLQDLKSRITQLHE